jgi:NTE family protein
LAHVALVWAVVLLAGCGDAHYPVNAPLGQQNAKEGYRLQRVALDPTNPGDVLVVLSLSGGGMRAAALAYGTLEALRDVSVPIGGMRRSLLDEVDIINAVSGGSIVAAYYAFTRRLFRLQGTPRSHVERDLQLRAATNAARLASPHFGRTDLLAEYFDEGLFEGRTFGDLTGGAFRPYVVINASDLSTGARFPFTQAQFDLLCSDLGKVHLARAVAASAALPPYFTAITLRNYAGSCEAASPPGPTTTARRSADTSGDHTRIRETRSYHDVKRRPYIHLVDAGLIDNLGVRASIDFDMENGGFPELIDALGYHDKNHAASFGLAGERPTCRLIKAMKFLRFQVMRAFELPVNAQSLRVSEQLRASTAHQREVGRQRPSAADGRPDQQAALYHRYNAAGDSDEKERDYFGTFRPPNSAGNVDGCARSRANCCSTRRLQAA